MVIIGVCFASPLIVSPDFTSHLLFGEKFEALGGLLPFFGLLIALKYVAAGSGVIVTAAGLQARRVICQLVGLATFVGLTLVVHFFQYDLRTFVLAYAASTLIVATLYAVLWSSLKSRRLSQ